MIPRTIVLGMLCPFLLAPWALYGAEGTPTSAEQSVCPVMEGNPIDRSLYVDYRGKRAYFCCRMCLETFKKNPEQYLPKLPQFRVAEAAGPTTTIESEHEYEPQAHQDAHEHAVGDQTPHGAEKLIRFVGKFHAMAIHFPIALVIAAALSEFLACVTKRDRFGDAARFNIILAALGGAAAILLGLSAGAFANYPDELARALILHKWLGMSAGLLVVITAALCEASYRSGNDGIRFVYRLALLFCVALMSLAGLFGGYLVYGLNHYAW